MNMYAPFQHPVYVMAKPAGASCNLKCRYCYYLEKKELYANAPTPRMSLSMLERFISQYIDSQTVPEISFTWHGGEPTLMPNSFYKEAMRLQKKYARGRRILNCLQTNGTLLNEEWCRMLKDNGWLVGISIDGPQRFHDEYRRNNNDSPTFVRVMQSIDMLDRFGVDWNAMAVVTSLNADHPEEFYDFFKSIGCKFLQFSPIVERLDTSGHLTTPNDFGQLTPHSVSPQQWGNFLCGIFDEWVKEDVGEIFVQIFDATLANYVGVEPGVCSLSKSCGHAAIIEYNGDVYSCDHFVFPEHRLGNIRQTPLASLLYSQQQHRFGLAKLSSLPRQCRECGFLSLCYGECPRLRFANDRYGNPGLNYLCEGYRRFFAHTAHVFTAMARAINNGKSAADWKTF